MTASPTPDQLIDIVRNGTSSDCIAFLVQYEAATRRRLADTAVSLFAADIAAYFRNPSPITLRKPDAARVAVLATGSLEHVLLSDWHVIPEPELLLKVFDTFQPEWTDAWVGQVLDENPYIMRYLHWLWEAGLCKKPRSDSFFHGLIVTPMFLHWPVATSALRAKPSLKDPQFITTSTKQSELVNDLWRFFEVKGRGEFSLGYLDHGLTWRRDFMELCEAGHMPRERLMDASLSALNRGFNQREAQFFARLYKDLNPTPDEQHTRRDTLLALFGSEIPSTVSFAVKSIKQANKHHPISATSLITALEPVFVMQNKAVVLSAIGLAKDAVKRAPDTKQAAVIACRQALTHKNIHVREAASKALEGWS